MDSNKTVTIRITQTPPGDAALEHIREQWVDVVIGNAVPDNGNDDWDSNANAGGYIVSGEDAFNALKDAGRYEAYWFWISGPIYPRLRFGKDICEVLED